jgi:hypothetical protein
MIEIVEITGRAVGLYGIRPKDAVNISALPAGIYLVRITVDKQIITKKIIKQ